MPTRHTTEPVYHSIRTPNLVVSTLALLLVIYASVFSWQSWQEEKADLIRNMWNIMALEEKAIDAYFTQIERDMLALGPYIIGTDDQIDIEHALTLVKRFMESNPELFEISVIRDDGQIVFASPAPPDPTLPAFTLEPSFLKFRNELQEGRPLSIGQPHICPVHNEWIIPLRYVISNKENKLKYIISVNLSIGMLQNYWKDAPFTKIGALGLIRDDGFLVARYPVPDKLEMEKIYGVPRTGTLITYLRQHQFPTNGYVRGPSGLDGPDYLNSFRRLEHFPITLFVAMPMSEIRTEWWHKVKVPYFLSVALFIGGFFIYRLTFQRERTREMERFHASETIRESEDRFRNLFERNVAIMLIVDPDKGNIIQANKAASDFYGWSIESLSNMCIQEINTLPSEAVMNGMNKAMSSGSMHLAFQHRRADNSIRDVDVSCCKIEMQGKAFLYSIIHDITERKHAEEKVKELNRDFISLLENTSDLIYFVDENCRYRFCSQTVANIAGHSSWRDMIGKHILEVFPEETAKIYYEENISLFREGKSILNKVNPFYDTLGNKGWISTNKWPLFDDEGRAISLLGISRDITESKQVQDKLRKSEERLSLVLEATQDGIWDWDLVDNTMYYSPRCWQLVGYRENELNTDVDLWQRLMHPEDSERINRVIEDAKAKDVTFAVEGRFLHEDGHYAPILIRGLILRDNGGKAIRVSGTSTDLAEQKRIEAERIEWERLRTQIEKAESLNRMADAIAHHFNNQLDVVVRYLELVLDVLPLGSDESERLIDAMKVSHRAADVSRQMLAYLGQAPGKLEMHDLSEICHKGLLMIQTFIPKNVSMEPVIPFPGPTIRANMSQMHQIFSYLLTNAWESIFDNKGTITISVKTVSTADISLSHCFPINWSPTENLYACLEVADTGCGITNADIEKVFDPFFTTKSAARGLNLAVVLGVVNAHGGGLTVESEVGKGSIFRVFLPVSADFGILHITSKVVDTFI